MAFRSGSQAELEIKDFHVQVEFIIYQDPQNSLFILSKIELFFSRNKMTGGGECFLGFKNKHAKMPGRRGIRLLAGVNFREKSLEVEEAN